jgi:hypothetical protein
MRILFSFQKSIHRRERREKIYNSKDLKEKFMAKMLLVQTEFLSFEMLGLSLRTLRSLR